MGTQTAAEQDTPPPFPAAEEAAEVGVGSAPACGCGGRNRLAGEYSGYTSDHLPVSSPAMLAIFAARMALSNFWIL